jgi:amino acid adenylation domain-containing protein
MSARQALFDGLNASAKTRSTCVAVEESDGASITYDAMHSLAGRVRDYVRLFGGGQGERVGLCMTKSIDAVTVVFGVLKAGAAYVPCDPHAPPLRNAFILADCQVKLAFVEERLAGDLKRELEKLGVSIPLFIIGTPGGGAALSQAIDRTHHDTPIPKTADAQPEPDDLAYILYTSGSTGRPKGVMLTHRNALSFVQWCSEIFRPAVEDRFSSHAPFHFDLSILDIYVPIQHGATLVLVGHELGKEPSHLADFIDQKRITVWYSAPSILSLMAQLGDLRSRGYEALRLVLFAGEVFPIRHLRSLREQWPQARFFNLYGPTETNVCTFLEVPAQIPAERNEPYPIGTTCSHLSSRVIDEDGMEVFGSGRGELCIAGPAVTSGYWRRPEQTAKAFVNGDDGRQWYRTGDVVSLDEHGDYLFHGRRDRMVKKRGYRVELGEIESCLYTHPSIRQAAVVAVETDEGLSIKAFVCTRDAQRLSLIALKQYCSGKIPLYMIPDVFVFRDSLPTTSTDKIAYEALKELG